MVGLGWGTEKSNSYVFNLESWMDKETSRGKKITVIQYLPHSLPLLSSP